MASGSMTRVAPTCAVACRAGSSDRQKLAQFALARAVLRGQIMRPIHAAASLALLLTAVPAVARADVLPEGKKYIPYSFTVRGIATTPDRVVFAYPCGTSSGTPYVEHMRIEDGKQVSPGSRGGACTLYTTTKAAYDEFIAGYTPTKKMQDEALDTFAKSSLKCTGAPSPTFFIPEGDSHTRYDEVLDAKQVDGSKCVFTSSNPPSFSDPAKKNDPQNPQNPAPSDPANPGPGTTPSGSSGDSGGCSVASHAAHAAAPWLIAMLVPAIVLGAARRRKEKASK
jgi:hypothetical protein